MYLLLLPRSCGIMYGAKTIDGRFSEIKFNCLIKYFSMYLYLNCLFSSNTIRITNFFIIRLKRKCSRLRSHLLSRLLHFSTFNLGNTSRTLGAQHTTTPVSSEFIIPFIEVGLDGIEELRELATIATLNLIRNKINNSFSNLFSRRLCLYVGFFCLAKI